MIMEILLAGVIGLVVGSFLGALSYRFPRGMSIANGRSKCPACKSVIAWHDNIPLLSYLLLRGRCRNCKESIPLRDFLVEVGTALVFILITIRREAIIQNISWLSNLNELALPFLLLIGSVLIINFVIDLEHQLIFDEFVFAGFLVVFLGFLLTNINFYEFLLSGTIASLSLLLINLITSGRGMGLGDVKLAVFIGSFFTIKFMVVWLFASFLVGGILGIILILGNFAQLKQKIAFAPFLIVGFFIIILYGANLVQLVLPF